MHAACRLLLRPLLAALLALGLASAAATAAEGRQVALVVGNGAYAETAALRNPSNDARAVAAALRGLGFEVLEATDLDHPPCWRRWPRSAYRARRGATCSGR